jgi:type IX secretion system PorP/SprF family membrane protein
VIPHKLILLLLLVLCFDLKAQNQLNIRQFSFNPYLFNPAYAGVSEGTEFTVGYRAQWVGFPDAPKTSVFTFLHPLSKGAIGFNLSAEKAGALQRSLASASYSYKLNLAPDHSVRFALSAGIQVRRLDLNDRDYSNDPAIRDAARNSLVASSSFGMLYEFKKLKIGFALPTLFDDQAQGVGTLQTKRFSQFVNQFYSIEKTMRVSSSIDLAPFFLYRFNRDFQNYWEGGAILHLKETTRIGFSYNRNFGMALFIGFTFFRQLSVNYSFEYPLTRVNISAPSHELQLRIALKKNEKNVVR